MINQLIIYLKKFCTSANYYVLFFALLLITPAQSHQSKIQSTPGDTTQKIHIQLSNAEKTFLQNHPDIRIGTDYRWEPYVIKKYDGSLEGFDIDLLRMINAISGANIQLVTGRWAEIIDLAKGRKIDGLADSAESKEREPFFNFTVPYVQVFPAFVVKYDNTFKIKNIDSLAGKNVAILKDNQFYLSFLKKNPAVNVIEALSETDAIKMTIEGKADACIVATTSYNTHYKVFPNLIKIGYIATEKPLKVVYSTRKDWPELKSILNKALASINQEEYDSLFIKWFNMDPIRHSTRDKEIRTVIVDNYFPYTFVNEQGEPDGLSVELIKAVTKELGMDFRVEVNTWNNSLDMLLTGEVNALSIMAYSKERDKKFNFSAPYTIAFDAYFTRKNSSKILTSMDLKEKKIIVNKKDQAHDYLKTLPFITEDQFIYESNTAEALKLLSSGKGDIAVMPKVLGLVLIKKLKIKNLILDPPIIQDYERPFSFAVKEGNLGLLERLENGLQIIKETGEYQKIYDKWLGAYEHNEISFAEILKRFSWFILAFILIAGALLLWTFMLRRQVTLRTRYLEAEITERKKAEEALRETNARHSAMIENIGDVIGIIGADDIVKYESPNIERCFGWKPEDLIGTKSWERVHPDGIKRIQKEFYAGIENENASVTVEYRYKCKDGTYTWIELTATNRINDTTINGVLLNFHDISDRKQAEEALHESEARFRTLFESVPTPVQGYNSDGTIHFWNKACEKIYGYTKEEAIGKNVIDLIISPEMRDFVRKAIKQGSKTGEMPPTEELSLMQKDGSLVPVLSSHALVKIDGKEPELYCLDIDMRLQKKLQSQIQQSQKMESIGTLAGGIAHDFNNILFPIVGHSEMLIADIPEDSPFQPGLKQIYTGALRASELVKQILTFSRQESSELILMKMQPIIKEALKLIRSTIPTTIEIKQNIDPKCGVIKADPTQIHQIVMNLSTNAYHAMEDAVGELKVSLNEVELGGLDLFNPDMATGLYVCLTVADTGKGMDKNITDKIFDPFFTTKEKGKGTGMGLSVVHGIVKSMNGSIQVDSEPGKGTQFYVYLPLEKSLLVEHETRSKAEIQSGTEQILLVDDEDAILTMEKLMLERLGYQVTSRISSIEALEAFRDSPDKFDLVITDMAMPNMPGNKLSAELIKIRPDIPVLLCTGFSETMSEESAASLGIKGLLLKPIVMKDLSQKIREVFGSVKNLG